MSVEAVLLYHEQTKQKCKEVIAPLTNFLPRCLLRKSDYLNSCTDWLPADETVFTCDFVYTGCGPWPEVHNFSQTTIHKQIVKIQNKKPNSKNIPHNVFIIAFDSTGMGQAYRNFPKSLTFLTKGLERVVFPYVNKVGLNTRPNAIPLLFGKSIEPQDKTVFGLGMTPGDWGFEESCNRYLDNESALLTECDQAGYRTFYGEDWKTSVLRYPDCLGFKNKTADHMFQPFIVELLSTQWEKSHGVPCGSRKPKELYSYFQQFLDSYQDEPKFAWVWSNDLSHDHQDGTIPFDTDLYSFLWKNKETLDNSFVFFMSDHGLRFGRLTNAPHGRVDLNNPMFAMSVQKDLRGNGILEMMKENAKNLQTHFDTRATLLDLLKYQQATNFTSRENKPIPGEKGSSYFREQIGERSCRTLPIPFQYCICEQTLVPLDATTDESDELGEATISYINQVLTEAGVLAHCGLWTYWNVTEISAYAPKEETNTFKIQVSAIEPYDRAVFRTMIMKRNHNEFFVDRVDRVDTYGHRGDCMQNDIQALCDCIQSTKENKESEARFNDYA